MKKLMMALVLLPMMTVAGNVSLTGVTAQQHYPWDGLVDITVTMQGSAEDVAKYDCAFAATNNATKAAIPINNIARNGDDAESGSVWTRKFIWYAKTDVGAVKIDDVVLTVALIKHFGGVQLWANGPYWAECNVGAMKPEESGYFFWWGDTAGYKRNASNNGWISVKDSSSYSFDGCPTYGKNISQLKSSGYIDATGNLVAKYDAATEHLGAPWRMMTKAELDKLFDQNVCERKWKANWEGTGKNGYLVTGKGVYASNSVFFPAAGGGDGSSLDYSGVFGVYWSSTPCSDSYNAWHLYFDSSYSGADNDGGRSYGFTVRPVRGFAEVPVGTGVTTHLALDSNANYAFNYEFSGDGIILTGIAGGTPSGALTIPATYDGKTVTQLGRELFAENPKITSVEVPGAVRTVGVETFGSCASLKALTLHEGVRKLDDWAFGGCAIETVTIPASLTEIAGNAFALNPIRKFVVDAGNPRYHVSDDGKLLLDRQDNAVVHSIANPGVVTIPEGIVKIGYGAFDHTAWTKINFPSTLEAIEVFSMNGDRSTASELDFSGTSLRHVDFSAFASSPNLRKIVFPSSLEEICEFAFSGCAALKECISRAGFPVSLARLVRMSK